MKSKLTKLFACLLVVVMAASFALVGCAQEEGEFTNDRKDTLVVAYSNFSEKFSPFFASSSYDTDVYTLTQVGLLATDRGGDIIYNGIEGETRNYNGTDYFYKGISNLTVTQNNDGTVDYSFKLRNGVKFSDGKELTVKDVIFSMYVLSDFDYDGSSTFYSLPIEGMNEWRTNLNTEILAKYEAAGAALLGTYDEETEDFKCDPESEDYTAAQFESFTAKMATAWEGLGADIINYVYDKYAADYADYLELFKNNKNAFGMFMWGFGDIDDDGNFVALPLGDTFTLEGNDYPSAADYGANIKAAYAGDLVTAFDKEGTGNLVLDSYVQKWIAEAGATEMNGATIDSITGITFDEAAGTINVRTTEFSATTVYQLGLSVAPLHYYGDTALWDPANGSFGFTRGDLNNQVRKVTTKPMGAGPYKFVSFQDGIVTFTANRNYWEGTPKLKYVKFKEYSKDEDKLPAVVKGEVDIATPSINDDVVSQIKAANGSDKLAVDGNLAIATDLVDFNGYGYLGINADNIKVGTNKASDESKALRKAFMTLFAAYREYTVNSYYHERASVIQYPITNCSWAAPQPADEGYAIAFSTDAEGNAIYNADMTEEQKYAAALEAAIGYFKAAGYTWDEATGKFTEAPDGAKLAYEAIIGGGGTGDHPTYALLLKCQEALESIGFTLTVSDISSSATLFAKMEAGTAEIFVAAWGGSVDPDMYQVYFSANATGSNHYRIADAELDEKIMTARTSSDTSFRKAIYKECLDIILDWAVELPVYQRKECTVYNSKTVKISSLTTDTTPYWSYLAEIYKVEKNG